MRSQTDHTRLALSSFSPLSPAPASACYKNHTDFQRVVYALPPPRLGGDIIIHQGNGMRREYAFLRLSVARTSATVL